MIKSAPICLCKKKIRIFAAAPPFARAKPRLENFAARGREKGGTRQRRRVPPEWNANLRRPFRRRDLQEPLFNRLLGLGYIRELAGEILKRVGDEVGTVAVVAFGHFVYLFDERLRQTYGYLGHADCLSGTFFTCHILFSLFYCLSVSSIFAGYA